MKKFLICVLVAVIVVFSVWTVYTNINIMMTEITICDKKLPADFNGFRIAQVSDLHNHDWNGSLIKDLRETAPDIIVITGDLIDSNKTDMWTIRTFVDAAVKIAPCYYVTGNHEAANMYAYGQLKDILADSGVKLMDGERRSIKRGQSEIFINGLKDPNFNESMFSGGIGSSIIEKELSEVVKSGEYNIVLSHRPEYFDCYVKSGVDLVFSGHAHGGQIRLPFIGGLYAPGQGFFPEYTSGLYESGHTKMIVSRGLGNSVMPVRINNMPELIIVTLNKK